MAQVSEESRPFREALRVRYNECDPQGHVFNANYLVYFDVAHTELLRAAVGPYSRLVDAGIEFVVADARLRFRSPARYDERIEVEVALTGMTEASLHSDLTVWRGQDRLVEGALRHVCVDAATLVKTPWPDWLRAELAPWLPTARA
jgi:acyl-CoA thioester hydrolase